MEWRIDTSHTGEVKAADLRASLEFSRDHWLETQADHVEAQIVSSAVGNLGKIGEKQITAEAMSDAVKRGAEAKAAHQAKGATLRDVMDLGIDQACAQAELFGGRVTATIVGHDDERHRSGCGKRLSVAVDQTWPE